jgi:hypothetical protein
LWSTAGGAPVAMANLATPNGYNAFAIDPLFLSANPAAGNEGFFPFASAATPAATNQRLPRISLRMSEHHPWPLLERTATAGMPNPPWPPAPNFSSLAVAESLFVSGNDVIFDPINPVTGVKGDRPSRVYHNPTGVPAEAVPQSAGDYSWMITVSPSSADPGRLFTASVVVFYKRVVRLPSLTAAAQVETERIVNVQTPFAGGGVGGGDIRITWTADGPPNVKAGKWVMLFAGDISGNPVPVRAAWYRIVASDDDPSDGAAARDLTLAGPDWPYATAGGPVTYAALFDTVVGVYEKTIQLE